MFLAQGHKGLLKVWDRVSAVRIPRRHNTPLTGIMSQEMNIPDLERLQLVWHTKKMILPKTLHASNFEIAAKSAPGALQAHFREPSGDGMEACLACDGGAEGCPVIREAALRF